MAPNQLLPDIFMSFFVCFGIPFLPDNFRGSQEVLNPTPLNPTPATCHNQKNPRVRKIRVRNSGAGNGSPNFMDTWKNAFFLQENLCP